MPAYKGSYHALIFFRRKCTGRIHDGPARGQQLSRTFQYILLHRFAFSDRMLLPLTGHIRILTEHAFSRTRSIDQYPVKKMRKSLGDPIRSLIKHHCIPYPVKFYILGQSFCTFSTDIISYQNSCALELPRNLRGFAPWRCTQI
ncbi:hypothetical protein D3C81_1331790 [compost metagenome]